MSNTDRAHTTPDVPTYADYQRETRIAGRIEKVELADAMHSNETQAYSQFLRGLITAEDYLKNVLHFAAVYMKAFDEIAKSDEEMRQALLEEAAMSYGEEMDGE